eukprot:4987356-Amphidinium_carterae.1
MNAPVSRVNTSERSTLGLDVSFVQQAPAVLVVLLRRTIHLSLPRGYIQVRQHGRIAMHDQASMP